jgi:ATP-dependent DNA helicase RecQ
MQDVVLQRHMLEQSEAGDTHKRVMYHKLQAMIGLCEMSTCRRQALLAYFGEQSEPCGNCDNCLNPPQTRDGTEAARKALSCVFRTGQSFGVQYVSQVLIGKTDERMQRNRHDKLSTFGIGKEHSATEWRAIFRQLVAQGHLWVDMDAGGALKLGADSRAVLRGEVAIALTVQQKPSKAKKATRSSSKQRATIDDSQVDSALFERLRALRLKLAKEQEIPPFFIFHDRTLKLIIIAQPDSLSAMSNVSGIGEQKLERYGQPFLDELRAYKEEQQQ